MMPSAAHEAALRYRSSRALLLLIGLTAFIALAAACLSVLTVKRQRLLDEAGRYDFVFDASQARAEFLRLRAELASFTPPGDEDGRAELQLRYAIVVNRMQVIAAGQVTEVLRSVLEVRQSISDIAQAVAEMQPPMEHLEQPGARVRVLALLAPLDAKLAQLSAFATAAQGSKIAQYQAGLTKLYRACSVLLSVLVVCMTGLFYMLARQNRRAWHIARHDALTGLPNRLMLHEHLGRLASVLGRPASGATLLLLDLDNFKNLNDTLGHAAGDQLLVAVAERLRQAANGNLVARLGGDEFAVLLPGSDHAAGIEVARRILAMLAAPFTIGQRSVNAGTSIGIAATASAAVAGDTLFKHADIALYEGKENGRGSFRLFDRQMEARLETRLMLEVDMRNGLANGEFHLLYQPLVHTDSNRVVGFEALMRWSHPDHGTISPAVFIPVAEETGMIVPLGRLALRQACREAAGWDGEVRVAVNLSPKQFRDRDLAQAVGDALQDSGLPPHRLELEITESSLLQDEASVHATLDGLRALGVRMALDDFGTGYSSLSYLQKFPFDKIKIDRAFVSRMAQHQESVAIVRTIVSLAQHLRMATTAEGVETAEMLALVRDAGCTEAQGFHFSRPLPPADAGKLVCVSPELALQA